MLAREKWQIKTIGVLERVFEERKRQVGLYGTNDDLEDGTGPSRAWLQPFTDAPADEIEKGFRAHYVAHEEIVGKPTWVHLVREELAEAFELDGDDPEFVTEILQVAALCVSWAEKKLPDPRPQARLPQE